MLKQHIRACDGCGKSRKVERFTDKTGRAWEWLCDDCAPEQDSKGKGTPRGAMPESERNYHGGRFNTAEW